MSGITNTEDTQMEMQKAFISYPKQITIDLSEVEAFMQTTKIDPLNIANNRYGIVFWMRHGNKLGWEFTVQQECDDAFVALWRLIKGNANFIWAQL